MPIYELYWIPSKREARLEGWIHDTQGVGFWRSVREPLKPEPLGLKGTFDTAADMVAYYARRSPHWELRPVPPLDPAKAGE
jgi:hypothetical protein